MRPACKLFGCSEYNKNQCSRCGTDLYDGDFVQIGWIEPLYQLRYATLRLIRKIAGVRCEVCGKRFWKDCDDFTCSDECFDKWLPF